MQAMVNDNLKQSVPLEGEDVSFVLEDPPSYLADVISIQSPVMNEQNSPIKGTLQRSDRSGSAPKILELHRSKSIKRQKSLLRRSLNAKRTAVQKNCSYEKKQRPLNGQPDNWRYTQFKNGRISNSNLMRKSRKNSENESNHSIATKSRRTSTMEERKERFESQFCQIQVLLVSLQIGLGAAVGLLGVRVTRTTMSLRWFECGGWAGFPLFLHGMANLVFCSPPGHEINFYRFVIGLRLCSVFSSLILSVACFMASVMSGLQGNKISYYAMCGNSIQTAASPQNETQVQRNNTSSLFTTSASEKVDEQDRCFQFDSTLPNFSCNIHGKEITPIKYLGVSCKILFTQVKDDLILQCSLMAVAGGACFWFACIQSCSRESRFAYSFLRYQKFHQSHEELIKMNLLHSSRKVYPCRRNDVMNAPLSIWIDQRPCDRLLLKQNRSMKDISQDTLLEETV